MKKIATKFLLVSASAFITASAMAQTDTTKTPVPDTTETPAPTPTDTTTIPKDTTTISGISMDNANTVTSKLGKLTHSFYAVTNRELLSAKQYELKTEEENEA